MNKPLPKVGERVTFQMLLGRKAHDPLLVALLASTDRNYECNNLIVRNEASILRCKLSID